MAGHGGTDEELTPVDRPEIILAPGPTPIPPEVLLAQGSPLVYHRGPGFGRLMREVTNRLHQLYRTDAARILLLTSSGTGGLESAIQNCFSPGEEVLVPLAGFFSQRWQRVAEAFGLTVHTVEDAWGTRLDPAKFAAECDKIQALDAKVIATAHSPIITDATSDKAFEIMRNLPSVTPPPCPDHNVLQAILSGQAPPA